RANVYPMQEFLTRSRHGTCIKSCRHCQSKNETCSHIIGNCPVVQDARIKRHNCICHMLSETAKKKDWVVFQEPHIRDINNELYKLDLIFVKENKALVVDVTVRYEFNNLTLEMAATEKMVKYQHLLAQVQELTNAEDVTFVGFPLGAGGKWYEKNSDLLCTLGLSKSKREKVARALASRALLTSVDIIHMFASKSRTVVSSA
ncbi:PO24 protein, partial [Formicarius rufipectus]|nr:PO24 protein [Formicarius rufipectus]